MKKCIVKLFVVSLLLLSITINPVNAGNQRIINESSEQNIYANKSIELLISDISEFEKYEDVDLLCIMALYDKTNNTCAEMFSDIIFDSNSSIVVRKVLMEICIKKSIPLEKNKLTKVLFDKNDDLSLRKFVLDYCSLQETMYVSEIEELIRNNESGLVYRALKKLFIIAPERALTYANKIMALTNEKSIEFGALQAAIEIIADKLYMQSTTEERQEYIEYCDTLLSTINDNKSCALILSAISSVKSKETFVYVLQSEKLSKWQKMAIMRDNQSVVDELIGSNSITEYSNLIYGDENSAQEYSNESIFNSVNRNSENTTNCIQGSSILSDGGGGFGHAGLMHENGFDANDGEETIIHVHQSFSSILYDDEEEFLSGNDFLGYFNPKLGITEDERLGVLLTAFALFLRTESINYSLLNLVSYNDSNNNGIIDLDEIEGMRCDGFVEYCYEYSGVKICYDDTKPNKWNITIIDQETQDVHSWTNIIPKAQAYDHMVNMLGDIDANGSVTASDAQLAQQMATGSGTYSQYQNFVADVDGDDTITSSDARLILRYSVGLEDIFPADPSQSDTQYLIWKGVLE